MRTNNEPRAMKELHDIRLQIYEETKNMTVHEKVEFYNKNSLDLAKEYGFKIVNAEDIHRT